MKERLQKIIARAGIASRRSAEELITGGRVSVNDVVVRQLGAKADIEKDEIRVDGRLIFPDQSKIYLMVNKPRGYVTTLRDPQKRPIVKDLLPTMSERVFPVGRLDYDSEGLLLMTNDGDFAQKIQHPRFKVSKVYRVKIEGHLTKNDFQALSDGIPLIDGKFKPEGFRVEKVNRKSTWLVMTITEGRNRLIRRGFEALNRSVARIIRIAISEIHLGDLKEGAFRHLTRKEVQHVMSPQIAKKPEKLS